MRVDKSKWERVKLGEVCEVISGATPKTNVAEYWSDYGHLWITPAELDGTKYIGSTARHITDFALQHTHLTEMPIGTVLLSSRAPIGKVAITTETMYCNQGFKNLVCSKSVYNEFLYFYLTSQTERLNYLGNGVTFKEISKKTVSDFPILLPHLSEQQAIAEELDGIQLMIGKCREQLEDYDRLARSIFHEMFGDPVRNDKGWECKPISDLGTLGRGVSKHRPRNAKELYGSAMPFIQTGDIANADTYIDSYETMYSELGVQQSKVWEGGTLCITIAANIGKTAILKFRACFPDSVVGFIANKNTDTLYIYYIFQRLQSILEANAPAAAQKNINLKILNALEIPLPPLPLQQQFAYRIESIEAMKDATKAQLADLQQLFDSRMQYYFS